MNLFGITSLSTATVFLLTCCVIFVNGATDAVNSVATCISSGSLKIRSAILLSSAFNFLGVLIMGRYFNGVMLTIKETVNVHTGVEKIVSACLLTIILWSCAAWIFGLPTSESHALTSALLGAGAAHGGFAGVDVLQAGKALFGVVFSLVVGCALGFLIGCFLERFLKNNRDSFFKKAQIIGCACMSFMHGGQDGLKFAGIFLLVLDGQKIPFWVILLVSVLMLSGTAIGGKKIIKTVSCDMVRLDKTSGFCADISGALCLFLASVLACPVSTTQTKASAMIGASLLQADAKINRGLLKSMVLAWVITFPACAVISYVMTKIII